MVLDSNEHRSIESGPDDVFSTLTAPPPKSARLRTKYELVTVVVPADKRRNAPPTPLEKFESKTVLAISIVAPPPPSTAPAPELPKMPVALGLLLPNIRDCSRTRSQTLHAIAPACSPWFCWNVVLTIETSMPPVKASAPPST